MATPYQLFYESIKSPATRKTYEIYIKKFFDYAHTDYDGFATMPKSEIEELVFNYVIHLKDQTVRKSVPNPNSYNPMLSPIQMFLEQNDIILNWKKIKRLYPAKIASANQSPYDSDDVRGLLGATTNIRNKAFIHFLASSGCRVGAIPLLNIGHVKFIENGAVLTIQEDSTEEYRTCLTPEATEFLKKYLAQRIFKDDEAPLFTNKDNIKRLSNDGAKDIVRYVRKQAKLSVDSGRKSKKGKSQNHAFRKRFEICLTNANVHTKYIEFMMGHFTAQDKYYFKGVSDEDLYEQFKKTIPYLTLDKSDKIEAEKNEEIRIIKESYDGENKQKLESLEAKIIQMEKASALKEYFYLEGIFNEETNFAITSEKLKSKFPLIMLEDWNRVCDIIGKECPKVLEQKVPISQSEIYQEKIKRIKQMKKSIKIMKNQKEFHPEIIAEIEQNGQNWAKEEKLDYNRYQS